jgi:DNA-directed RNA polymerase subunit RPC12/RpoP
MRRIRRDKSGALRCYKCGSDGLLAKSHERDKRAQHLKCEDCGTRQRYRQPKQQARVEASLSAATRPTVVAGVARDQTAGARPTPTRISWRRPDP